MRSKRLAKFLKTTVAKATLCILIAETVLLPISQATTAVAYANQLNQLLGQLGGKPSSTITKLENLSGIDYEKYLDSTVTFKLPETIKDDQEIAVVIALNVDNILDSYNKTDKSMNFTDYALNSEKAKEIEKTIAERKSEILKRLDEKKVNYKTGDTYSTLLSGFELVIKAGDYKATCQSLGKGAGIIIGEEYKVAKTQLVSNKVNVYGTGIFDSSMSGYDGSGMVVAVLDTGLDSAHTAFSTKNFTSTKLGLTYDKVASVISSTTANKLRPGLTVDDVYINEKVPFGYDYADNDPDVYSTHNNHGTHVSGVIVGKDDVITGVAPNAQLVSMKIFSDVVDTARATWILSALEDCVVLGVDVINMSLGTACGFSRESDEEILNGVYDRIRAAGISMIVAASNSYSSAYGSEANGNLGLTSNPDTGTVGSPSTYKGVFSVASIAGVETPYILYNKEIIYFVESNNGGAEENNFVETLLGDKESIDIEYITIPGVGRSADYTGLDVKGKIVLVRRGSNTFEEKAIIAQQQGAAGIIIYNNVSGDIKMNVGEATLAVCSISQDHGEMLASKGKGTIKISKKQTSGPFISDFSSWGPTPDLLIKPEITAHGGSILSSVTGGSYERLSGTSMACPNLAGVIILMRQYVTENFPDIANDNVKVNAFINQLIMSTADIALGKNALPYAVRKQGAGLANLMKALATKAYVSTFDKDGNEMDKTKLELGDDKNKTGIYEMTFAINNFGDKAFTYKVGAYVLTEGVSETKTNAGLTTVTEESYLLDGATIKIVAVDGGTTKGNNVTVDAGKTAKVTVVVTLSDKDKKYLDDSFENGMYVEGFITLDAVSGTDIDMNVPYLAFYGDWTKAPLFDKDYYETNADELDKGLDEEDKTKADAYPTRPIGGLSDDYVSVLGSYYFIQDPKDIVISANRNYIALSNQEGTVHSLRFVWAGLLRNAQKIVITITDDTTGEVVYEVVDTDVRKSYGDGGSIYPANIEIEFDTMDYNFANNSEYTVRLVGYLDYDEGGLETNKKNVFEFPLVIDIEAPTVTGVEYRFEYDTTLKKNRLYADVSIFDNHYSMAAQLGYVTSGTDSEGKPTSMMTTFEQHMTPIYSKRNATTVVTYELTDYLYEIKGKSINKNSFAVTCYDYALNLATYEIPLPDNFEKFIFEGTENGITINPNEVYALEPLVYPATEWGELIEYTSSKPSVARVVNNKLIGVSSGKAIIKATNPTTGESITFNVTVLKEGDEGYVEYDKPVADVFRLTGFETLKAYYMVASEDKKIGDTGSNNYFEGNYELSLYPSETVRLKYVLNAYYPNITAIEFESSNESIVKIDQYGNVTAVAEGFASVTIKVSQDGKSTYYSETVSVEVKDPYVKTGSILSHYYGNGGLVDIPKKLLLTEIGSFAFSNFEYVMKSPEELLEDDRETSKQWFIGDNTITKVIIPEGVKKISAYAFANLTALEEIVLPSTLEAIEYGAFYGCKSLKKITFSSDNNLKIINQHAFENCDLQGTIDLSSVCVVSDYAFAGNKKLEKVTFSDNLLSIGQYAFAACKKLSDITITAPKVKYGMYAFTDCESLKSFYVNASVIPEGMFYQCESLTSVTIGPDVNDIGAFAFRETKVNNFEIKDGNKTYKVQTANYILSADGSKLIAIAPTIEGAFTKANIGNALVTVVGKGAFSHNKNITSVTLENVTVVEDYGFASCDRVSEVKLGKLTVIGEYGFFETAITKTPVFTKDTKIGKYAFSFTEITSVTIPNGMVIEEGLFSECLALKTVVIGDDVTIGKYAFSTNKDLAFDTKFYDEAGERYFYYVFESALTSLTIGKNAVIGESAFANAASIQTITLGENATIGKMAFYNNCSLKNINLSKAVSIGDYAFSGDVYYICLDDSMSIPAVSKDGKYMYTYHGPRMKSIDLSSATTIGEYAFAYCRDMDKVALGANITSIPKYCFAGCIELDTINLGAVTTIGEYAFMEDALVSIDLSSATTIGEYAFVSNLKLKDVKFAAAGASLDEGAFAYCEKLNKVDGMVNLENIGDYAFAYTALTKADLTGAVKIGKHAFMKEQLTAFEVVLGEKLTTLGDNPFAMCKLEPFHTVIKEEFAGLEFNKNNYTYNVSDTVYVIDGSLYNKIKTGLVLITFAGTNTKDLKIADDTVRISAMAFAGTDVEIVTLPYTVKAIGHKAFYDCKNLKMVVFTSYNAPILEEEYDPTYYESFKNVPGSGDYGTYTDYDGTEVTIHGMGLIPFFMWNATGGQYSNVFYGANFVDYIGYVENKLVMVKPINGQNYDTYIMKQYFNIITDGASAADNVTLAAIAAINAIPKKVSYEQRGLVEAARLAYSKIATIEQQALVKNYSDLVLAEQRIKSLAPSNDVVEEPKVEKEASFPVGAVIAIVIVLAAVAAVAFYFISAKKNGKDPLEFLKKLKKDNDEEIKAEKQDEETETLETIEEVEVSEETEAPAEENEEDTQDEEQN